MSFLRSSAYAASKFTHSETMASVVQITTTDLPVEGLDGSAVEGATGLQRIQVVPDAQALGFEVVPQPFGQRSVF